MAVSAMLEIALRNTVYVELSQAFGQEDWLQNSLARFNWAKLEEKSIKRAVEQAQRAAYSKRTHYNKLALNVDAFPRTNGKPNPGWKHNKIAKERQKTITVPDSQVIAQLTTSFWKRLFAKDYEIKLWKPAFGRAQSFFDFGTWLS